MTTSHAHCESVWQIIHNITTECHCTSIKQLQCFSHPYDNYFLVKDYVWVSFYWSAFLTRERSFLSILIHHTLAIVNKCITEDLQPFCWIRSLNHFASTLMHELCTFSNFLYIPTLKISLRHPYIVNESIFTFDFALLYQPDIQMWLGTGIFKLCASTFSLAIIASDWALDHDNWKHTYCVSSNISMI